MGCLFGSGDLSNLTLLNSGLVCGPGMGRCHWLTTCWLSEQGRAGEKAKPHRGWSLCLEMGHYVSRQSSTSHHLILFWGEGEGGRDGKILLR